LESELGVGEGEAEGGAMVGPVGIARDAEDLGSQDQGDGFDEGAAGAGHERIILDLFTSGR